MLVGADGVAIAAAPLATSNSARGIPLIDPSPPAAPTDPATLGDAALVENANDAIIVRDLKDRIVFWNRGAQSLYGWSRREAVGNVSHDLLDSRFATDRSAAIGAVREHGIWEGLVHHRTKARTDVEVWSRWTAVRDTDGQLLSVLQADRDLASLSRVMDSVPRSGASNRGLEDRLTRTQTVAAVGRLAGGIACDLNNLLSAITGYLELVRPEVSGDTAVADLDEATSAAYRAAHLARQLLVFSRSRVTGSRVVQPNDVVSDTGDLIRSLVSDRVRVETDLDGAVPGVRVDPAQLEQALVCLAINANEAMPNGGTLRVATRLADAFGARGEPRAVTIEVSDTGIGMDEPTRVRASEPFFTTKGDRDVGLGLTAVQTIASHAGGSIAIVSAPGAGTRVSLTLPVSEDPMASTRGNRTWPGTGPRAGRSRVLLVEDDNAVRVLARRLLQAEGHTIIEARTGEEALARWREAQSEGHTMDVVVTDVVMPDMGGRELIAQLRAQSASLPVVYVSGYLADAVAGLDLSGPAELLEKPFSAASLNAAVEAVLGHGGGSERR